MKRLKASSLLLATTSALAAAAPAASADALTDAITSGKAYGDFRLRYEDVEQDNARKDATALTLRSRLGYTTGSFNNFSATVEFEDNRIWAGESDFSVDPAGFHPGEFSVIADPETSELDQGFLQYKTELVTAKLGRQVIAYDGHRFVGHVGWRQDRQTFDAARIDLTPAKGLVLSYSYLDQRNRIFAEAADQNAKDHLLNLSYQTPVGKLVAYGYLLEVDNDTDNALDTYGVSFSGSTPAGDAKLLYTLEYASQDLEVEGQPDREAEYLLAEGGVSVAGITAKLSYEVLGSDDGLYGFSTPLSTLHKFNGWADTFLNTPAVGLVDAYATLSTKVLGGKLSVIYHDYSADEDSPTLDDLGSELNVLYARKFGKNYNAGIKYADYSADDFGVDTEKLWVWVGLSF